MELFHRRRPQLLPYPETLEMFDIAEEYASILFYDRICKVYRHLSVMQNPPAELMKELAARAKAENDKRVEDTIKKAVVNCYAIEGKYPATLTYVEEYYGLQIDRDRYDVFYEVFADNIMPEITVISKK